MFDKIEQTIRENHIFSSREIFVHKDDRSIIVTEFDHDVFIKIFVNSDDMFSTNVKIKLYQNRVFDYTHAEMLIKNGYEFEIMNSVLRFNRTFYQWSFDIQKFCDAIKKFL